MRRLAKIGWAWVRCWLHVARRLHTTVTINWEEKPRPRRLVLIGCSDCKKAFYMDEDVNWTEFERTFAEQLGSDAGLPASSPPPGTN